MEITNLNNQFSSLHVYFSNKAIEYNKIPLHKRKNITDELLNTVFPNNVV